MTNPKGILAQSPGLERHEPTLGLSSPQYHQPQRGCGCPSRRVHRLTWFLRQSERACHNPVGVEIFSERFTQGSSFVATLGFETQSLWDWENAIPIPQNSSQNVQTPD